MNEDENNQNVVQDAANKTSNAVNKVTSAPQTAEKVAENAAKISKKLQETNHVRAAQAATKVASGATKIASVATKVVTILSGILVAIVILIIIIGLVTFLISGLGLIFNGIKQISHQIGNYLTSVTEGSEYIIEQDQMQDVMNYLVGMNYDLYGYGFVEEMPGFSYELNEHKQTDEKGNELDTESSAGTVTIDEQNYKTAINSESEANLWDLMIGNSQKITKPNPYRYLMAYLVSDNYASLIKTNNINFRTAFSSWSKFFTGAFVDANEWGSGLISVYYEKRENGQDVIGVRGNDITTNDNDGYVGATVKVNNGKLVISSGDTSNIKFKYDMDGWIGRYGMPLEFLLSTHLATMAPDLSYRLATSFNTDVEILLHKSDNTDIQAGVVLTSRENITDPSKLTADGDDKNIVTKKEMDDAMGGAKDFFNINRTDVMEIFRDTMLESPAGCIGVDGEHAEKSNGYKEINLNSGWENSDRSTILEGNNIDAICNAREEIINQINDLLLNDPNINKSAGLEEISMDTLIREAIKDEDGNETDVDEFGRIIGTVSNKYVLDEGSATEEEKYIGSYISEKVYNDIKSEDLVEVAECSINPSNDTWIDDKPYKGWRENGNKHLVNLYSGPHFMPKLLNTNSWDYIQKYYGNVAGEIGRRRYLSVIWDYSQAMKNWLNEDYDADEDVILADAMNSPIGDERLNFSYDGDEYWAYEYAGMVYHNPESAHVWDQYDIRNLVESMKRDKNDYSDNVKDDLRDTWNEAYHIKYDYEDEETQKISKYFKGDQEISSEDTKRAFKWIIENNYSIVKKWDTLQFLDQNDYQPWYFMDATKVDFFKHTDLYAAKEITGTAYKPMLKENNETWNFSFYNRTADEQNYFITISISTGTEVDGTDYRNQLLNAELVEESKGHFTIDIDDSMGGIYISYTADKISDDDLKKAIDNDGEIYTCSKQAKTYPGDIKEAKLHCCPVCYNYVKEIYKALRTMDETNMTTYVPYVNRVTDHWYRNVYFTKAGLDEFNKDKSEEEKDHIIQTDMDYEAQTGERWTLYDTYEEDGKTNYELYVFFKDGNGEYSPTFEKDGDDYIVCRKTEKNDGQYDLNDEGTEYILAKDEDGKITNKGKYKLQKKVESADEENRYQDTGRMPDEFRVGKKAILKNEDEISDYTAYDAEEEEHDTGWQILDPDNEDQDQLNPALQTVLDKYQDLSLVSRTKYKTVKQIEDGIRGETNSEIKKIFLDDYYIFDGTKERASAIQNAKYHTYNKIKGEKIDGVDYNNPDAFKKVMGEDYKIVASYLDDNNATPNVYTIDQISGKINLSKDSLNAFAILKNMKTLDAEYIYHDFKELIVELNYFDKEDLVEGSREVMMFPVANINSEGWVDAKADKNPNYYGTLIHSAQDYAAKEAEDEAEDLGIDNPVVENSTEQPNNNTEESEPEEDLSKYNRTGTGSGTEFHRNTFYSTAQRCWEYIVDKANYDYDSQGANAQIPAKNTGIMNDRIFVQWVLYEYGYEDFRVSPMDGYIRGYNFYIDDLSEDTVSENERYGWEIKTFNDGDELKEYLQPGDIVTNAAGVVDRTGQEGRLLIINSVTKTEEGTVIKAYDCSQAPNWALSNKASGVDVTKYLSGGATVIRVDVEREIEEYEGFYGAEPVIAPVSGQIIDYGTTKRTNIETGESEEVGFIKIRVLDETDLRFVDQHLEPTSEGDSARLFLKGNYDGEELKKLGFDYFEEEYQGAGIAGNVLYLEGFDISEIEKYDSSKKKSDKDKSTTVKNAKDIEELIKKANETEDEEEKEKLLKEAEGYYQRNSNSTIDQNLVSNNKGEAEVDNPGTYNKEGKSVVSHEDLIKEKLVPYIQDEQGPNHYKTEYTVPNILDNAAEFKLKVHEEAKKMADYLVEVDGKYYIKEGAVIGYTYEAGAVDSSKNKRTETKTITTVQHDNEGNVKYDSDNNPITEDLPYEVGSYLRMILRDLDDEVVEDVENYVETANNEFTGNLSEEFIYWMGLVNEGVEFTTNSAGELEYFANDLGDGVGPSGPFGLTYFCQPYAEQVGYPEFAEDQRGGHVKIKGGDDVFVATLEAERDDVLRMIDSDKKKYMTDYMFYALVDIRHAGPLMLQEAMSKFNTQGYLSKKDFESIWGTNTQYAAGLQARAKRRGALAIDEMFTSGNESNGYFEIIWPTNKPWSDYLETHVPGKYILVSTDLD